LQNHVIEPLINKSPFLKRKLLQKFATKRETTAIGEKPL